VTTLEVSELRISERTAQKLLEKHALRADDVRAAVEGVGRLPFSWTYDDERGWRAIIITAVREQECVVVLYPATGELGTVWNLGSAYAYEPQ
jgi:hypothetical protein